MSEPIKRGLDQFQCGGPMILRFSVQILVMALIIIFNGFLRPWLQFWAWVIGASNFTPADRIPTKRQNLSLKELPSPPPLPIDIRGKTVGFSGCANLAFYCLGALAALQEAAVKSPEGKDILSTIRFSGLSSSALIAALGAADVDAAAWLEPMIDTMQKESPKAPLGLPYRSLLRFCAPYWASLLGETLAAKGGSKALKSAQGRCGIFYTSLGPLGPESQSTWTYASHDDLVKSCRGSSYGPVVDPGVCFRWPEGIMMDGAISCKFPPCDIRVSPYPSDNAQIGRRESFTSNDFLMQVSTLTKSDAVTLYCEGWSDCVRWLKSQEEEK